MTLMASLPKPSSKPSSPSESTDFHNLPLISYTNIPFNLTNNFNLNPIRSSWSNRSAHTPDLLFPEAGLDSVDAVFHDLQRSTRDTPDAFFGSDISLNELSGLPLTLAAGSSAAILEEGEIPVTPVSIAKNLTSAFVKNQPASGVCLTSSVQVPVVHTVEAMVDGKFPASTSEPLITVQDKISSVKLLSANTQVAFPNMVIGSSLSNSNVAVQNSNGGVQNTSNVPGQNTKSYLDATKVNAVSSAQNPTSSLAGQKSYLDATTNGPEQVLTFLAGLISMVNPEGHLLITGK